MRRLFNLISIIIMNDKERLEFLKNINFDIYTIAQLNFLEKEGIHNWVWPSKWCRWLRVLTTWLFSFLDWKRHDDSFWKQEWFHKANWGILKYSHISLAEEYRDICKRKWYKKIYQIPKYHLTLPIKSLIISLAYNAVESEAWKKAYNNSK